MRELSLTQRQAAMISFAVLVGLLTMFYAILVVPATSGRTAFKERLDELQLRYIKYQNNISQIDSIRQELESLRQSQPNLAGFLQEKQPALAAADLQRLITDMIVMHGGEIMSTQVIERTAATMFPKVTINVTMRGGIDCLQRMSYQISTSNPVLVLENMQIQSNNRGYGGSDSRSDDPLDIQFEVSAFTYQSVAQ